MGQKRRLTDSTGTTCEAEQEVPFETSTASQKRQKTLPIYRSVTDHSHFKNPEIRQSALRLLFAPSENNPFPLGRLPFNIRERIYEYVFRSELRDSKRRHTTSKAAQARKVPHNRKTDHETGLVVNLSNPFWLHRLPGHLLGDVEQFVYAKCTVIVTCGSKLSDRNAEVLKKAQSIAIDYDATPAQVKDAAMPILLERDNLKYLRITFTSWPLNLRVQGRHAAMLVGRKLFFLTEVKADHVVLELKNFFMPWKFKVLQRLANIMMGDEAAKAIDVISNIPIIKRQ